jgi:hypothetical protein
VRVCANKVVPGEARDRSKNGDQLAGTRRFNSSDQFCTTWISRGADVAGGCRTRRKMNRSALRVRSYVRTRSDSNMGAKSGRGNVAVNVGPSVTSNSISWLADSPGFEGGERCTSFRPSRDQPGLSPPVREIVRFSPRSGNAPTYTSLRPVSLET